MGMPTVTTTDYADFLAQKRIADSPSGFYSPPDTLNPMLFDWQREITSWALRRGRAAIFADCGLGKTPIQLEWAREVHEHTGEDVLILAPLAVASQTQREGAKFGVPVTICRTADDVAHGVNIANYERLHHFDPAEFAGIVLDESSILKAFLGITRMELTRFASKIPYRLCCTATPAPNDLIELQTHSEFLDVMSAKEMASVFFTQDGNSTQKWRLKGHAERDFWAWMASWSIAVRRPSDLGYQDDAFILPELDLRQVSVDGGEASETLFVIEAQTLLERRAARRDSLMERVDAAAAIIAREPDEQWLVWCDLNAESEALTRAIDGAVEIRGSHSSEYKSNAMLDFADEKIRVLVTKPSIAGFGMNWQQCARMLFVGLSDSYEAFYQAVRRCWRFGQQRPVVSYVVTSDGEGAVVRNIERKERQAAHMMDEIAQRMNTLALGKQARDEAAYERDYASGDGWVMHLGDSVEVIDELEPESAGLVVFSPPFPGMYAYTNSPRDMGNVANQAEMIEQFKYLIPGLYRVTQPGRSCCIHLTQGTAQKGRDGYIGIKDFRGAVIAAMEAEGWIYYGEVCIDKNPQVKAIRTKDAGLLFKSLASDSSRMHMALADYLLQFRKPGDNAKPIMAGISERYDNPNGWITADEWIEWAAPVWYGAHRGIPGGIRETDVLNVSQARETNDERHLCPLQLGVIERCVKLWSAPGDSVLSPFAGIGSEGVGAIRHGRKFVGIELKRSYWMHACRNLTAAVANTNVLFIDEDAS